MSESVLQNDPPLPLAHVTMTESDKLDELFIAVKTAFQDAMAMRGRLREEAFNIQGYSGKKIRLFFNNLMSELTDPSYLEIGVFHGASFCSALFQNRIHAVGIDNWSWINEKGARARFDANLANFKAEGSDIQIVDSDFRQVDFASLGRFNVMYYDGPHSTLDQYDGVAFPLKAMASRFILIIDDWNWDHVRHSTLKALQDANARIEFDIAIRTTLDGTLPDVKGASSEWHNGLFCAVVSKSATA